jgi:hypothetical protein
MDLPVAQLLTADAAGDTEITTVELTADTTHSLKNLSTAAHYEH